MGIEEREAVLSYLRRLKEMHPSDRLKGAIARQEALLDASTPNVKAGRHRHRYEAADDTHMAQRSA